MRFIHKNPVFAPLCGVLLLASAAARGEAAALPLHFEGPLTEERVRQLQPAEVRPVASGDKRLDAWWETWLDCGSAAEGGDIRETPHWTVGWQGLREKMPFDHDRVDNPVGDFAVVFEAARAAEGTLAVGLHPGPFLQPWNLDREWALNLWLKGEGFDTAPALVLVDAKGNRAVGAWPDFAPDGAWHELTVPLSGLQIEDGFDFGAVRAVQFEQAWPSDARLGMDGVRFIKGDLEIGVTDKALDQRMDEARRTRLLRMRESIVHSAALRGNMLGNRKSEGIVISEFSLWPREGLDLEDANRRIGEEIARNLESGRSDKGGGIVPPIGPMFYWMFGSRSSVFPGRMTPEVESLLEEWIWKSSERDNDIHIARMPSLWVWSSENHDSSWRVRMLQSSALFKDLPDYQDRLYPDRGFAPGYPGHGYPPDDADPRRAYYPYGGEFGPLSDGKRYDVPAHYEAWRDLWTRYLNDRAQINFWLEEGGAYQEALLRSIYAVYLLGGDTELTQRAGMFLDLFWLRYAQNSLLGYHGGPKHRASANGFDSDVDPFATFQLGGPAGGQSLWYWRRPTPEMMISDYELPRVAWRMMLDKKGMGAFEFVARSFGEENNIIPRPEGTQNLFLMDGEQRMVRYRYHTPDYLFSTMYQSPETAHSHLSLKRLQGLQVPSENAFISPGLVTGDAKKPFSQDTGPMHGVQEKSVFVGYLDPLMRARGPEWFPAYTLALHPTKSAVYMAGWSEVVERDGWIFGRAGEVYAAVRIVIPQRDGRGVQKRDPDNPDRVLLRTDDVYVWNDNRTFFRSSEAGDFRNTEVTEAERNSGGFGVRSDEDFLMHRLTFRHEAIILEAGRQQDFGSYEKFQEAILANKLEVWQARFAPMLVYRGAGEDAKEIVLNLLHRHVPPMVDGTHIDYETPWTWRSPFMKSEYKSGIIDAEYGGDRLRLDFNELERVQEREE